MFNKYTILSCIGEGGTAKVYLVKHNRLNALRAIKCISKYNPYYGQLLKEAHILKDLQHSNIPTIYDIEEDSEYSYIIEEYIEGESLKKYRLNRHRLKQETIIDFGIQLGQLILYLHHKSNPILYLDLKPENIIVNDKTLKLIDFGAAVYKSELNENVILMGTKGYAAPEQWNKNKVDEKSDIFGIGTLLFFLMTGKKYEPQEKISIDESMNYYSKRLRNLVNKCLSENAVYRYYSMNQVISILTKIKSNKKEMFPSLKISVAGVKPGVGTTHISILLSKFLNQYVCSCLYQEENPHKSVMSMIKNCNKMNLKKGVFCIEGCYFLPKYDLPYEGEIRDDFSIIVKDIGVLNSDNIEIYKSSDIQVLVIGSKEWEQEYYYKTIKLLGHSKHQFYFYNFSTKQFQNGIRVIEKTHTLYVPYVHNPFKLQTQTLRKRLRDFVNLVYYEREIENS